MSLAVDIVKREGRRPTESFLREKLYNSILAACLSARTPEGQAEAIAGSACDHVMEWLSLRPEVTSQDLRIVAAKHLRLLHPDAAYLYEQHKIII